MDLQIQNRTILGKKVKKLRREGLVPAELYGHGTENRHLTVKEKDFEKTYEEAGEHTIVTLTTGAENIPVLISYVNRNPITRRIAAADFHRVRMDEKIRTHVPIEFTGEPAGVKQHGLVFVTVVDELEIEALPNNIPHSVEVEVGKLENPGDTIHLGQIKLPEGVRAISASETVLCSLAAKEEETLKPTPAVEAAATDKIKKTPEEKKVEKAIAASGVAR